MRWRDGTNHDAAVLGRRRRERSPRPCVALTAALLVVAACGMERDQNEFGAMVETRADRPVESGPSHSTPATPIPTTPSTISQEPIGSAGSPGTTVVPFAEEQASTGPCPLTAVGFEQLLVFGNSTDYTFQPDGHIEMTAWPELLAPNDRDGVLSGVTVRNEAQRGQTMGNWDAWGPDPRLRLNGYAPTVLDTFEPDLLDTTLVLFAPSFIDLQENGFDSERALVDLGVVLATLEEYGLTTIVLPMNYVSTALNDRLPDLNPAIERFNDHLAEQGGFVEPFIDSPLRVENGDVGGDERLFDDFPGRDRDGRWTGPDGFHPDAEGQLTKADDVLEMLATFSERASSDIGCP